MPKAKWNLNTIYISERLQESLRPISRSALTTVVAPMGYGKTTAVNWYLAERTRTEALKVIRISVYSDNLAIFWRSVQDAFARAGFAFLRDYTCPEDTAGGGASLNDIGGSGLAFPIIAAPSAASCLFPVPRRTDHTSGRSAPAGSGSGSNSPVWTASAPD